MFNSRGLVALFARDRAPQHSYMNLENVEVLQEGVLSSRLGRNAITTNGTNNVPLAAEVHTLGRMKSLSQTYRYAGSGTSLSRRAGDTDGAYTSIETGLSGSRFSTVIYRPDFSAVPYAFFADGSKMLKDDGTFSTARIWGIFRPPIPPTAVVQPSLKKDINLFDSSAGLTFTSVTGTSTPALVNTTLGTVVTGGQISTVTPAAMTNIQVGMVLRIDSGGGADEYIIVLEITATTFKAFFANSHTGAHTVTSNSVQGSVAANTEGKISQAGALNLDTFGSVTTADEDEINLFVKINSPANLSEMKILFDVGNGNFDQDYYWKSIVPSSFQQAVSGVRSAADIFLQRLFNRGSGRVDLGRVRFADGEFDSPFDQILPGDDPLLEDLLPIELLSGESRWSRITVKRSEFVKTGLAGQPGKTWANVGAWRLSFKTIDSAGITLDVDSFYLLGGYGPDVFAGISYDYRITFFNNLTGAESNPSIEMPEELRVNPRRQGVVVSWTAPTDPQVTHVRVYRRGGTLPTGWKRISQVAIGTTTYTDALNDLTIAGNNLLELDNDPPVTSALKQAVETTLGTTVTAGSSQTVTPASMTNILASQELTIGENDTKEIVVVQSVTGTQFTAYFQRAHTSAARVYGNSQTARPLKLAAVAFEKMWLAGDANNPNILYHSKKQRPESFPPQNTVEVGTPDDPIMTVVEWNGQVIIFKQSSVYRILNPTGTPYPIPTASDRGLHANFGWAIREGVIWFQSYDGVYAFSGANSQYGSQMIEWLFTDDTFGPVTPMDRTQISSTIFAANEQEVFVSYVAVGGARKRLIYEVAEKRWRNDNVPVTAMLFEKDVFKLIIGRSNGMIYEDRVGSVDNEGDSSGVPQNNAISLTMETQSLDQGHPKNEKTYNEFTIDIDTSNQPVTLTLLFDNGTVPLALGTVTANGRQQVSFSINSGQGQKSRNVALRITGSVTAVVHIYEAHIRASVDAESRKSQDTNWNGTGVGDWKYLKQGWFEYEAPDATGITVNFYVDGNLTSPVYSVTLPQSVTRKVLRIRFGPPVKFKIWRLISTSPTDFKMYEPSNLEMKSICGEKGYGKVPFVK
jgi:hypothetical protein